MVATVVPSANTGLCTLLLSVHDTGIGMTTEEQAKLFLPFAQANSKTFTTYGGSGMGLFITKELLGLMGGAVRVQSVPDLGTTFTLEIPVHNAASASEYADRQPEALAGESKRTRHDEVPAHEPAYSAPAAPAWPTRQLNILGNPHPAYMIVGMAHALTIPFRSGVRVAVHVQWWTTMTSTGRCSFATSTRSLATPLTSWWRATARRPLKWRRTVTASTWSSWTSRCR